MILVEIFQNEYPAKWGSLLEILRYPKTLQNGEFLKKEPEILQNEEFPKKEFTAVEFVETCIWGIPQIHPSARKNVRVSMGPFVRPSQNIKAIR